MVWTPNLRPLGVYHRQASDGRTACGLVTPTAYGYLVPLGEALALSDEPCGLCFDAPRPTPYPAVPRRAAPVQPPPRRARDPALSR